MIPEKLYIAGPMRGIPGFNFDAFNSLAAELVMAGAEVFNPAERDANEYGSFDSKDGDERAFAKSVGLTPEALRRHVFEEDTRWICRHATGIVLLPGWEQSKGARAEKALAEALGLRVYYAHREYYAFRDEHVWVLTLEHGHAH